MPVGDCRVEATLTTHIEPAIDSPADAIHIHFQLGVAGIVAVSRGIRPIHTQVVNSTCAAKVRVHAGCRELVGRPCAVFVTAFRFQINVVFIIPRNFNSTSVAIRRIIVCEKCHFIEAQGARLTEFCFEIDSHRLAVSHKVVIDDSADLFTC